MAAKLEALERENRELRQALAETINGLYKTELIHPRGPWRSFEAVEFAALSWVDWFNYRRLLEPIGNIVPAEGGPIRKESRIGLTGRFGVINLRGEGGRSPRMR